MITKFTVVEDTSGAVIKAHSPPISGFVETFVTLVKDTSFPDRFRLGAELYGVTPDWVDVVLSIGFIERTEEPFGPGGPCTEEPILAKLAIATFTFVGNVPNIIAPNRGVDVEMGVYGVISRHFVLFILYTILVPVYVIFRYV